jgi:hypothetical protein
VNAIEDPDMPREIEAIKALGDIDWPPELQSDDPGTAE